jgi:hypothetical protein
MLVIVEDGGGLGNRIFVFANVIVTGLATGHRVVNPAFRRWAHCFEGTEGDCLSMFPKRRRGFSRNRWAARVAASLSYRSTRVLAATPMPGPVRAISLEWPQQCDLDDPATGADLQRRRLVFLKGWLFRNPSGIQRHGALLRKFFNPVTVIRREAAPVVNAARRGGEVLVGVHVRHRDYREYMNGRFFYPLAVYFDLMRSVAALLRPQRASFLLCSDEQQDEADHGGLPFTFSRMGPVHDLWALSQCDLVMGPPSTFSAWAAFFGDRKRWEVRSPDTRVTRELFKVPLPVADGEGWC